MENNELIPALRLDAEWAHANEWETPIMLGDHLDAAADALAAYEDLGPVEELAALKEQTRWIPVDEKPPEGEDCFVYERRIKKVYLAYAEELDTPNWAVTHWMPFHLPEAPKEAANG